jgi:hypothetical protein
VEADWVPKWESRRAGMFWYRTKKSALSNDSMAELPVIRAFPSLIESSGSPFYLQKMDISGRNREELN